MNLNSLKVILIFLGFSAIVGFGIIWLGLFNIAATDKHWAITNNLLEFVRERSITSNAVNIKVPNLSDKNRIAKGAANYDAMCAQCHLAPGIKTSELYEGLYPQPPVLYEHGLENHEATETFWVIKNGLKMTGMPAWGNYNSDDQIWDLMAFIFELKNITPEEYKQMVDSGEHTHDKGGHAESTETVNSDHHNEGNKKTEQSEPHGHDKPHGH
jgi:mono/diheme cytochrome c family protein